jgi:uncharacterized membrane protein
MIESDAVKNYLSRLAESIEALGETESAEVVKEVRAHLYDAIAETDGDENAVWQQFGSPEVLAARILEERGRVAGGSFVPEATVWRKTLAMVLDLIVWLGTAVLIAFLVVVPIRIIVSTNMLQSIRKIVPINMSGLLIVPILWVLGLVIIIYTAWGFFKNRRKPGHTTAGMQVLGLRQIRFGETTRLVSEKSIPGASRRSKVFPVTKIALTLFLLLMAFLSMQGSIEQQAMFRMQDTIQNASSSVELVTYLYQEVLSGTTPQMIAEKYGSSSNYRKLALDLIKRRDENKLATYAVENLDIQYNQTIKSSSSSIPNIIATVAIGEYAPGAKRSHTYYYRVEGHFDIEGGRQRSGGYGLAGMK